MAAQAMPGLERRQGRASKHGSTTAEFVREIDLVQYAHLNDDVQLV